MAAILWQNYLAATKFYGQCDLDAVQTGDGDLVVRIGGRVIRQQSDLAAKCQEKKRGFDNAI
ncbi:MAG: hypothetical protein ACI4DU_08555 [Lachnospiraceae bacterium]